MKKLLIITLIFSVLSSCRSDKKIGETKENFRWVGDIEQNNQIDKLDFKVCNGDDQILQYFNLGKGPVYGKEKSSIINTFKSKYKPLNDKTQNGLIRIRFIVNCEGKSGRFRVLQSDYNYQKIQFNKTITTQLLNITKDIIDWKIQFRKEKPIDYYMYLIFKIDNGQLTEILP